MSWAAWVHWRGGVRREVNWQKIAGTGGIEDPEYRVIQQGFAVALSADGRTALIDGPMDNGGSGATWVFSTQKSRETEEDWSR